AEGLVEDLLRPGLVHGLGDLVVGRPADHLGELLGADVLRYLLGHGSSPPGWGARLPRSAPSLKSDRALRHPRHLAMAEAGRDVVVHHAHRLHERVADGGADEPEPALLEVLARGLRCGSLRGKIRKGPPLV